MVDNNEKPPKKRTTIVINSDWVRKEQWDLCGREIQIVLGSNAILTGIDQLRIIDELGIEINNWFKWSFDYSIERKKREQEIDKDEY